MESKMKNNRAFAKLFAIVLIIKYMQIFVLADDDGETATTEFDPSSRGPLKFGDKCEMTQQCGFAGSICYQNYCTCSPEYMSTNHVDKCGKAASVNETCFFNEQCEDSIPETECRESRCICRFDKTAITKKDGSLECIAVKEKETAPPSVNPAMYLILVVMALMFIIICVVLRLFSKARWRENRTIFNTPNPRLMNVSLLRDNKLLHGGERRGSRMSVRIPSRQPSMASLRPHSPNASIGSRGSRNSNASATSPTPRDLHPRRMSEHRMSIVDHPTTVVRNPSDLLNVNQQQHLIHQNGRRRSSVNHAGINPLLSRYMHNDVAHMQDVGHETHDTPTNEATVEIPNNK